jgi:hypothetical protein
MRLSNIPFKLESAVSRTLLKALRRRPSSAPFVSGDSFRAIADYVFEQGKLTRRRGRERNGAPVVFVRSVEVRSFFSDAAESIDGHYVLVTNNGDENISRAHLDLLDDRVIHWFAQNALVRDERITGIPIGLENANMHCNGIVSVFSRLRKREAPKTPGILAAFTVGNNREERAVATEELRKCPVATLMDRTNSRDYQETLSGYMFVASPAGNGFDCHRTWEALYLGVIPVVRRHAFFDWFPDLPFIQLDDWGELQGLTEEKLLRSYTLLKEKLDRARTLWMDYWVETIEEARRKVVPHGRK